MSKDQETFSNQLNISDIVKRYTKNWKWFVLSAVLALIAAFLYIRYSIPQYSVSAQVIILEEKTAATGFSVFQDLDIFSEGGNKVEDEIQLLRARSSFIEMVKRLGLNVKMISLGNIVNSEIYENKPININFIAADSLVFNSQFDFFIDFSTDTTFGYSEGKDAPRKSYAFGKNMSTPLGDMTITPNGTYFDGFKGKQIQVSIRPAWIIAQQYRSKTAVIPKSDFSNVIKLSLNDPIPKKGIDILNTIIQIYNQNGVEDKKEIADRTSQFINDRITDIYSNLSDVDQTAEDFKTGRGITDLASQANLNLSVGAANEQELQVAATQLDIASSMKDFVDDQSQYETLPSNIGLSDASIASTTASYNQLIQERKRLLQSSNEKNPIIQNINEQLDGLKNTLKSSLNNVTNNLELQVNRLGRQLSQVNSRIYSAPKNQRALRDITRQQETTESLYLYLLQKREESQIAFASAAPKSRIVDEAHLPSLGPVSPKRPVTFLAALILGFLFPFSVIYIKDLLDNKIHNMFTLEQIARSFPVLGELPKVGKKDKKLVLREDRSVLSESLRILRTNLDYLIRTKKSQGGKNNVIFVTSSVSGEGKTFLSTNLSMILASTNRRVVLLGADIRNPKLYSFFTGDDIDGLSKKPVRNRDAGLTEYLLDDALRIKDVTNSLSINDNRIDVIYSGRIPPNPAELLMSNRFEKLFAELSDTYDYVLVDTAPLMLVSDTLLISQYAHHTIYVTRAHTTEKSAVEFPMKMVKEGKIKGLSFVVNDVKINNLGYGGKYGYGYGKSIKKWWKF